MSEIIDLFIQYKSEIEMIMPITLPARKYLAEEKEKEMAQRYLKGAIDIKDLTMQFNCPEHIIKQILIGQGVVIVCNNKSSKGYRWRPKKKSTSRNNKKPILKNEDLPKSDNSKYISRQVNAARTAHLR